MTSTTEQDIWFSGPVKDAISLVAEKNAVFLVYIHGNLREWPLFLLCINLIYS
jgi:hypothetical protein